MCLLPSRGCGASLLNQSSVEQVVRPPPHPKEQLKMPSDQIGDQGCGDRHGS